MPSGSVESERAAQISEVLGMLVGTEGRTADEVDARARMTARGEAYSRAAVVQSQRARLLLATAHVVAEVGYHRATIDAIKDAAGVSKKTFYVHFTSKEEAFLAAYELGDVVFARMLDLVDGDIVDIVATIDEATAHYLGVLAMSSDLTRMLLIEALAATPRIQEARSRGLDVVTTGMQRLIALAQRSDPRIPPTPDSHIWAMLAGVNEMCVRHVTQDSAETLPRLRPDIVEFVCRVLQLPEKLARG